MSGAAASGGARQRATASPQGAAQAPGRPALPWPHEVSHEPSMKIGELVSRLSGEFPALSISKVRYLEAEGLLHPHRVGNGYRRYSAADLERLRFTLTAQRDEYLPLSVIRDRLAELDAGAPAATAVARVVASHGRLLEDGPTDLDGLVGVTGASRSQIEELVGIGLVAPDERGVFDALAVRTVRAALQVHHLGVPLRNLRAVRAAADREADTIEQAVRHKRSRSQAGGEDAATALVARMDELHGLLLRGAVGSAR